MSIFFCEKLQNIVSKIHKIYARDIFVKNIWYTWYSYYSAKIIANEVFRIYIFRV